MYILKNLYIIENQSHALCLIVSIFVQLQVTEDLPRRRKHCPACHRPVSLTWRLRFQPSHLMADGVKKSHGWPGILPSHCPKLSSEPAFTPKVSTSSTLILRTDVSTWQAISKIEGYDVFSQKTSPHGPNDQLLHVSPLSSALPSQQKFTQKTTTTFRTFAPHPHLYSIYVGNVNLTSSGSSFNGLFLRPKNWTPKISRLSLPHFFQMKSSIPSFGVPRQVAEYPALK